MPTPTGVSLVTEILTSSTFNLYLSFTTAKASYKSKGVGMMPEVTKVIVLFFIIIGLLWVNSNTLIDIGELSDSIHIGIVILGILTLFFHRYFITINLPSFWRILLLILIAIATTLALITILDELVIYIFVGYYYPDRMVPQREAEIIVLLTLLAIVVGVLGGIILYHWVFRFLHRVFQKQRTLKK